MNQAVVGARPDHAAVPRRRRERIDDAAPAGRRRLGPAVLAHVRGRLPGGAGQVGADLLPAPAAVARLPHRVGREVERARIGRREDHRLRAHHPVSGVARRSRHGRDVLHLPGVAIPARELAAVDDVRVERVRRRVAVLLHAGRVPVAEGERAVGAARRDACGSALLLAAAEPVGEGVVGGDVEHLRGGLVVPAAPGGPAVHGDDHALIGGEQDRAGPHRVDPDAVVVVAAGRAAEGGEGLPAVHRLPGDDARRVHDVRIGRIHLHLGEIVGALRHARVLADARPALAGVVGSIEKAAVLHLDRGEEAGGARRREAEPDPPQPVVLEVGQPARERLPGGPAVHRFVEAAARPGELAVLPGGLPRLPERGIDDLGIGGIDQHVDSAGVRILVEDAMEGLASVQRAEDAALLVGPVRVAEHGHEEAVGVFRIDRDLRDLLAVAQPEVPPGKPAVDRLVDPVASGKIGPLQSFAAGDVEDVRAGGGDRERPDAAGGLPVEDRRPGAPVIVAAPHASVHRADIEEARPLRDPRRRLGPAAAMRSDVPPIEILEERSRKKQSESDHLRALAGVERAGAL